MAGLTTAKVIDLHAHIRLDAKTGTAGEHGPEIGTDAQGRITYRVGKYTLVGVKHSGSPFTEPPLRIERMDKFGIDFQVVSPSPLTYFYYIEPALAIDFTRRWNDACADIITQYPDRLAALATLPMQDPAAAASELKRAVREKGFLGAAIGTDFGIELDDPRLDDFYNRFVELNVPLFIHPAPLGLDGPDGNPQLRRFDLDIVVGFAAQETIALSTLIFGSVLHRHPKLDIWISHGGGAFPFLVNRLTDAAHKRPWASQQLKKDGEIEALLHRIWYDSHVGGGLPAKLLTDVVGADRIVFGTNFAGWDAPADEHHEPIPAAYADNARRLLRHQG